MKVTSQILSLTSLIPTFWPAKTVTEVDLALAEANAAAVGDGDGSVVERILELAEAAVGAR